MECRTTDVGAAEKTANIAVVAVVFVTTAIAVAAVSPQLFIVENEWCTLTFTSRTMDKAALLTRPTKRQSGNGQQRVKRRKNVPMPIGDASLADSALGEKVLEVRGPPAPADTLVFS